MTSTILNSEVRQPIGRSWSVPQTRGRRELPTDRSSTVRVPARSITAPPVSDVHYNTEKGHLPLLGNKEGRPIGEMSAERFFSSIHKQEHDDQPWMMRAGAFNM